MAAPDWPGACVACAAPLATLAVVHRYDGDDLALALAGPARPMAARRQFQLRRSHHRCLGTVGPRLFVRWSRVACLRAAVRAQSRGPSSQPAAGHSASPVRTGGASAASRSGCAQRLWTLECVGPCLDAAGIRLPDRPVRDRTVTGGDGASVALGARHGAYV